MNWFKSVTEHIHRNLEDYIHTFLTPSSLEKSGKHIKVNPCPFCGHNDCFSLTRGFNGANCFSCGASGNLIAIVEELFGEIEGRRELGKWSGIKYNYAAYSPKKAAAKEKYDRYQQLLKEAMNFYHRLLINGYNYEINGETVDPLEYQLETRKHTKESLVKYQVGFSYPRMFNSLKSKLLEGGFTEEEIEEAKEMIALPHGYFIYPYFDAKGNLIRLNGKLFVRTCRGTQNKNGTYSFDCSYATQDLRKEIRKEHEEETGHKMAPDNTSRGTKLEAYKFAPKGLKNKKYLILVEGENDLLSVDEALQKLPNVYQKEFLVACIGGSSPEGMFESGFLRQFQEVYSAFDNDEAGDKYREQLDREMPEVRLKQIKIPDNHNDIDEFLKLDPEADALFAELLDEATPVKPKHLKVTREGKKHIWSAANRNFIVKFEIISYKSNKNSFHGKLTIYKQDYDSPEPYKLTSKTGPLESITLPGNYDEMLRLRSALSDEIDRYYHNVRWINDEPERNFDELLDIFRLSRLQKDCYKMLAWYMYHANRKEKEYNAARLKRLAKDETEYATVLKEMTAWANYDINWDEIHPKIHLSQSLFPDNDDAYMYFTQVVQDGDDWKKVPCLLSNKKEIIRLDILKKKEAQSMILIDQKYELPEEVGVELIERHSLSLQQKFVDLWKEGKIDEEHIHPTRVIGEIEAFIRSTYFAPPEIYKVLSLWIYSTYFYQLFKSGLPYLLINGGKGTGKSTVDQIIQLLAFNPTFTVNTTEAALFRRVDFLGGTIILDEQENLHDSKEVDKSGVAAILKSGYADNGVILRTDPNTNHARGYNPFGPKVISNINGLDDVISDRCIRIDTAAAPESEVGKLKNVYNYKQDKRKVIYDITSRAAISSLTHFKKVHEIFHKDTRIDTGNLRLTQLLRPLITMARLVGGDYEEHLMRYYETAIKSAKQEVKDQTIEGIIENIIRTISEELLGKNKEHIFIHVPHIYEREIPYDKETGMFTINTMHFKVFAQEVDPDRTFSLKEIQAAVKTALGPKFDFKNKMRRTRATIDDEGLLRQQNGNNHPNVYEYYLNVRDFVPKHTEKLVYESETTETLF